MDGRIWIVWESKLGDHRIFGGWQLDEATPPGMVGAWRDYRDVARARRLSRPWCRIRRHAWLLPLLRRRERLPIRKTRGTRQSLGDPAVDVQILSLRFNIASYMDCALKLKQKYSFNPESVVEVVCRTAEGPVHRLWKPLADKQRPVSSYGAKFSLPYSISVMLIRGRAGLEEFTDEAIRDSRVLDLAKKVGYELDPTIDYPRHFSGHVKIKLKGGTVLEENQPYPRGGLEEPLLPEEIEDKFRANARLALADVRVERIIDAVRQIEQLSSITSLADLLVPA